MEEARPFASGKGHYGKRDRLRQVKGTMGSETVDGEEIGVMVVDGEEIGVERGQRFMPVL